MAESPVRTRRLIATTATGGLVAAGANLVLFGLGRAAGLDFVVERAAAHGVIRAIDVVSLTLMAFALGTVIAAAANLLHRPSLRTIEIVAAVLAVVSVEMDLPIEASIPARCTLATMHLLAGAAYVASVRRARSTTTVERPTPAVRTAQPVAA
jgi:hypothetical protein